MTWNSNRRNLQFRKLRISIYYTDQNFYDSWSFPVLDTTTLPLCFAWQLSKLQVHSDFGDTVVKGTIKIRERLSWKRIPKWYSSPIACISADLAADGLTEPLRFDHFQTWINLINIIRLITRKINYLPFAKFHVQQFWASNARVRGILPVKTGLQVTRLGQASDCAYVIDSMTHVH